MWDPLPLAGAVAEFIPEEGRLQLIAEHAQRIAEQHLIIAVIIRGFGADITLPTIHREMRLDALVGEVVNVLRDGAVIVEGLRGQELTADMIGVTHRGTRIRNRRNVLIEDLLLDGEFDVTLDLAIIPFRVADARRSNMVEFDTELLTDADLNFTSLPTIKKLRYADARAILEDHFNINGTMHNTNTLKSVLHSLLSKEATAQPTTVQPQYVNIVDIYGPARDIVVDLGFDMPAEPFDEMLIDLGNLAVLPLVVAGATWSHDIFVLGVLLIDVAFCRCHKRVRLWPSMLQVRRARRLRLLRLRQLLRPRRRRLRRPRLHPHRRPPRQRTLMTPMAATTATRSTRPPCAPTTSWSSARTRPPSPCR